MFGVLDETETCHREKSGGCSPPRGEGEKQRPYSGAWASRENRHEKEGGHWGVPSEAGERDRGDVIQGTALCLKKQTEGGGEGGKTALHMIL